MKEKKVFVCTECDHQSPKWVGRCPGCGKWNTLEEETYTPPTPQKNQRLALITDNCEPVLFDEMEMPEYIRSGTGIGELDRVLGGGVVNKKVLENCGIDSSKYSGLAFGIGIERIAMLKYGINHMGKLFENDVEFLKQFKA